MSVPEELHVHVTAPDGATRLVGTLSLAGSAQIQSFTYDPGWLRTGFELGTGLPLQPGILTPPGGQNTFGIFDDAGPDSWGRRVIARSRPLDEVNTSLGMLAAVADYSRQGALRFTLPDAPEWLTSGEIAPLTALREVLADVEAFAAGSADRSLMARLYLGSSSQGGARPKSALVRDDGTVVLAKFPSELDLYDVITCEAVALTVARKAGIAVPDFRLERIDHRRAILILDRFDRTAHGRLSYQSMRTAAMLSPFETMTYQMAARTARYLAGPEAVLGVVEAAALAICLHNIDDHARNLGFLGQGGTWRLAPLFDIVPYPDEQDGTPLTSTHPGRSLEAILDLDWGIPRDTVARRVAEIAASTWGAWESAPSDFGLDEDEVRACRDRILDTCDFTTVLDAGEPRYR